MSIERLYDASGAAHPPDALYAEPGFPEPPAERPYVYVNMVATVDGKTRLGPAGTTAKGLGGPTDQMLMRRLEQAADAALVGAGTLRAGPVVYPPGLLRATVTRSGDLPFENRFFTDAPGKAIVFAPATLTGEPLVALQAHASVHIAGADAVDMAAALRILRAELGVRRLLLEGGPDLNDDFLSAGLVDEFFLTIAPKLKGGGDRPTVIDGRGLPGREWVALELRSLYHDGDELYLRYRLGARQTG